MKLSGTSHPIGKLLLTGQKCFKAATEAGREVKPHQPSLCQSLFSAFSPSLRPSRLIFGCLQPTQVNFNLPAPSNTVPGARLLWEGPTATRPRPHKGPIQPSLASPRSRLITHGASSPLGWSRGLTGPCHWYVKTSPWCICWDKPPTPEFCLPRIPSPHVLCPAGYPPGSQWGQSKRVLKDA